MTAEEFRERMDSLQAQMKELSDSFYDPIVREYVRRCAFAKNGKRPSVAALAKEFGASQSVLNQRINKTEFEVNRRQARIDEADARETDYAHYHANVAVVRAARA